MDHSQKAGQFSTQSSATVQMKGFDPIPRRAEATPEPQTRFPPSAALNPVFKSQIMVPTGAERQGNQASVRKPGLVFSAIPTVDTSSNPSPRQAMFPPRTTSVDPYPVRLNPIEESKEHPHSLDSAQRQENPQDCPLLLKPKTDLPGLSPRAWNAEQERKRRPNAPEEEFKARESMVSIQSQQSQNSETKDTSDLHQRVEVHEATSSIAEVQNYQVELDIIEPTNKILTYPTIAPIPMSGQRQEQLPPPSKKIGINGLAKHRGHLNLAVASPQGSLKSENLSSKGSSSPSEVERTLDFDPHAKIPVVDAAKEDRSKGGFTAFQPQFRPSEAFKPPVQRSQKSGQVASVPFKSQTGQNFVPAAATAFQVPVQQVQKNGMTPFAPTSKSGAQPLSKFGPAAAPSQAPGGQKFAPGAVLPIQTPVQGTQNFKPAVNPPQKLGISAPGRVQTGVIEGQKLGFPVSGTYNLGMQQTPKLGHPIPRNVPTYQIPEPNSRNLTEMQGPGTFPSPQIATVQTPLNKSVSQAQNPFQNSYIQCTTGRHLVPANQIYKPRPCSSTCQNCCACLANYLKGNRRTCPTCRQVINDQEVNAIEAMAAQFRR